MWHLAEVYLDQESRVYVAVVRDFNGYFVTERRAYSQDEARRLAELAIKKNNRGDLY